MELMMKKLQKHVTELYNRSGWWRLLIMAVLTVLTLGIHWIGLVLYTNPTFVIGWTLLCIVVSSWFFAWVTTAKSSLESGK